jgi:hypothetical protein
VPDEQFVILEMRAVVGFRVQDQLGVRKKLLQDVGVDGCEHDVVAAVDDQDRKSEALGAQSQAEGHVEGFVCLPRWRSAELEGHVLVRRLTLDLLADRSGPVKEIIGSRGSVVSASIRLFGTCRMDHEPSCRSVSASSSSAGGCRFSRGHRRTSARPHCLSADGLGMVPECWANQSAISRRAGWFGNPPLCGTSLWRLRAARQPLSWPIQALADCAESHSAPGLTRSG